ncbi:MAG: hypothetical protein KBB95_10595 [Deltaproteobacteria bacterium]|nr:hypothetical protein [Deltaproteobacteria bacterium]
MAVLDSDTVDVWIMGFDLAPEDAAEGIAWAFEMDLARAAALVASVPRAVRRGVTAAEAAEAAEALGRAGADVELCPEGLLPARLEAVPEAATSSGGAARGPRVRVKKVIAPSADASSALLGDEPAYGEGSSAYVPIRPLPGRAAGRRAVPGPLGVAPPVAVEHEVPGDHAFEDDLELGSLIPAPMRAPAPASLRPPGMPSSAPPAASTTPSQAGHDDAGTGAGALPTQDDLAALQTALASLPKVRASPRAAQPTGPKAQAAVSTPTASLSAVSPPRPATKPAADRPTWVVALGGLLVIGGLFALGRSMFADSPPDDMAAVATESQATGLTDAQLLASTADYVSEDARTWLRLGEHNHFGDMSASESRVFLERLGSAGALSANVGLPTGESIRAGVLLLQHSPLHRAGLVEAASAHPVGRVVPAACVEVAQRYIVIRFDGCP